MSNLARVEEVAITPTRRFDNGAIVNQQANEQWITFLVNAGVMAGVLVFAAVLKSIVFPAPEPPKPAPQVVVNVQQPPQSNSSCMAIINIGSCGN